MGDLIGVRSCVCVFLEGVVYYCCYSTRYRDIVARREPMWHFAVARRHTGLLAVELLAVVTTKKKT